MEKQLFLPSLNLGQESIEPVLTGQRPLSLCKMYGCQRLAIKSYDWSQQIAEVGRFDQRCEPVQI